MPVGDQDMSLVLRALAFSAEKHRYQRRKGDEATPYINHSIEVAELLWTVAGVRNGGLLAAAILHDTLEDTDATPEELDENFGADTRGLVEEVTDDKRLPKAERKRLQVETAADRSDRAKLLKLADKISNVHDIGRFPPASWGLERKREYLAWAGRVVDGLRGCNAALERRFDEVLEATSLELEKRETAE